MSMYYSPLTVSTDTPSGALERTRHTILGWPSRSGMTGCFVQACEAFTDRVNGLEEVVLPGSFPLLAPRTPLRRRRVRHGRRTLRIVRVLQHSLPLERTWATRALGSHARAQRRRQASRPPRVRSHGVHQAGLQASMSEDSNDHHTPSCPRLQHALCDQLEQRQAEMLDEEMRRLPAVQTASMGVIPDPRLASWAEMCAIGRAFVVRQPTPHKVLHAHERRVQGDGSRLPWGPLAAGHPNRRRPPSPMPRHTARKPHVVDKWGFALLVGQEPRGSTDSWRSHHDAVAHVIYGDATRAGIEGRNKAYSRASYPPQTPAATAGRGTAWSRTCH